MSLQHNNIMEFQYRLQRMEMRAAQLFDPVRKRWVKETPEELVRQCLILWLQISLSIPYGRMGVEKQIQVLGLTKRFDLLIYNKQALPLILIECKSPQISLNQAMFDQAAVYNLKLMAPYLSICNGLELLICEIDFARKNYHFVGKFPEYPF